MRAVPAPCPRSLSLQRAIDEKFRCLEEKEGDVRRLQLALREKETDQEKLRCVLSSNEETILVLSCTSLCYTALHCAIVHFTVLYCTSLCYSALHCAIVHFTVL